MIDPMIQAAKEQDMRDIKFSKEVEEIEPIIEEDYSFFKNVMLDYFPDKFDKYTEEWKKVLHNEFMNHSFLAALSYAELYAIWKESCYEEAIRRTEE